MCARCQIAEPMAEVPGAERVGNAYFGLYLLAMGRGRPRTQSEISAMMRAAGLSRVTVRNLSGGIAAIHAGWRL